MAQPPPFPQQRKHFEPFQQPAATLQPWPSALRSAVLRAHQAEAVASGPERRVAFRRTRALISGARIAGFPLHDVADLLKVSVGSVRNRCSEAGMLSAEDIAAVTGLAPDSIDRWRRLGWLGEPLVGHDGRELYPADDIVRVLCHLGDTET